MAKKKAAVEERFEEEGHEDPKKAKKKAPKRKSANREERVAKPETGARPLSVGGIIERKNAPKRDWEAEAPWNRKDERYSRFTPRATNRSAKD
jgi:hypothetical protein